MRRFNDWLGDKISYWLSTMTMFYIVALLVLAPLLWERPKGIVGWMQYAIAVFFQGAALPVLGYVARIAGEKQEKILRETHDASTKELGLVKEELGLIKEELRMTSEDRQVLRTVLAELQNNRTAKG